MRGLMICIFTGLFIQVYSQTDTIYWQKKASCPCKARVEFGYFLIDSDFYIMGGLDSNVSELGDVWKYSIPTDQWLQMRDLPEPSSVAGSFSINGKGYFLTARDSINNYTCDSAFFEYDPRADSWTRKANLSDSRRQGSSAFSYNGKGYLGFGISCGMGYCDMWQYDTLTNLWTEMSVPPASVPVGGVMGTAVSPGIGMAYIIDGWPSFHPYQDMWGYNIIADNWDSLMAMPGPGRVGPLVWSFDTILLGGAGEVQDSLGNLFQYGDFYRYDVAYNAWTNVQFMNFLDSVCEGASFVIGNTGYFYGGYRRVSPSISLYNDIWSFDATPILPHDSTTVGIRNASNDGYNFKLYPNPVHSEQNFQITTSAAGQISFYNSLGQILFSSNLNAGMNKFNAAQLNDAADVVFYRATMKNGSVENGRIVVIR